MHSSWDYQRLSEACKQEGCILCRLTSRWAAHWAHPQTRLPLQRWTAWRRNALLAKSRWPRRRCRWKRILPV